MGGYWAEPEYDRHQMMLISPTLDDVIPADHPIRQLDEILNELDWTEWERRYNGQRGQPPIHPRLIAGAIFWGLLRGIRTSRRLEDAAKMRVDFMWFLNGTEIDHTTFSKFQKRFDKELKSIFHQINCQALRRHMSAVVEIAIDGTRMRANSDRHGARTATILEKRIASADAFLKKALEEMAAEDLRDDPSSAMQCELKNGIAQLEAELEKLHTALQVADERDTAKRSKDGKNATPVRVPVTDPDSQLLPNKEGGYSPNYTPTAAVDRDTGLIVDTDVLPNNAEASVVQPAVEEVEAAYGQTPERVSCDSGLGSGGNQAALSDQGIEVYTPADSPTGEAHPAWRVDPTEALPENRLANLPRSKNGKLERNAFLYDETADCYWCPMGRQLNFEKTKTRKTVDDEVECRSYICEDCSDCPLSEQCLSRKARQRRVTRDQYEVWREQTTERMGTEKGKEVYGRRAWIVETIFGHIKRVMGCRQFLTRGIKNVKTEWLWICTAYNVGKLLRICAADRQNGVCSEMG